MQELKNELNDKEISLNEYKEKLNTLSNTYEKEMQNTYEKEIQKLKKELKESKWYTDSNKKDKSNTIKKINELDKNQQKYIEEKKIEQELNEIKQELNKKNQN